MDSRCMEKTWLIAGNVGDVQPQSNKRKNEDDNEEDNSDRRKRGGRN